MMDDIRKRLSDLHGEDLLFADGFDDAIVGVSIGCDSPRVVYCYASMVESCMNESDMSYDDAIEWIAHNTVGSYVGVHTPIYVIGIDE